MKKIPIIAAAAVSLIGAGSASAQSFQGLDVDTGHSRIAFDDQTVSLSKVDANVGYGFGRGFGVQGDLGYLGLNADEDADAFSFRLLGRYDMDRALSFGVGVGRLVPFDDDDFEPATFYSMQAMYLAGPVRVEGGVTHYDGEADPMNALSVEGHYEFVPGISKAYGGVDRLSMDGDYADLLTAGYEQGFGTFDLHGEVTRTRYDNDAATGLYVGGSVDLSPDVEFYGELGRVTDGDDYAGAVSAGLRWQMGRGKDEGLFSSPLSTLDFAGF